MLIFRIITTIINALLLLIFFQAKVDPKDHNMRLGIGLIIADLVANTLLIWS